MNKDYPKLAERLHEGMKRAIKNGTFEAFFQKYYGNDIAEWDLNNRTVIDLRSADVHRGAPIDQAHYWYANKMVVNQ